MKVIKLTAAQHDLLKTMLDSAIENAHEEGHALLVEMRGVWTACARATTEPAFEEATVNWRPDEPGGRCMPEDVAAIRRSLP